MLGGVSAKRSGSSRRETDLSGQYHQHAGCVIGIGGIAGHMFVDMPADRQISPQGVILQDMSAVTAACMMMKRSAFLTKWAASQKNLQSPLMMWICA